MRAKRKLVRNVRCERASDCRVARYEKKKAFWHHFSLPGRNFEISTQTLIVTTWIFYHVSHIFERLPLGSPASLPRPRLFLSAPRSCRIQFLLTNLAWFWFHNSTCSIEHEIPKQTISLPWNSLFQLLRLLPWWLRRLRPSMLGCAVADQLDSMVSRGPIRSWLPNK